MSTRISTSKEQFQSRDGRWLGDKHGLDIAVGGTLVLSTFTQGTHFPDGYLKDGLPVTKNAAGKFELWTAGEVYGFILDPAIVKAGDTEVVTAIYHHGGIALANLPVAVTETDLPARLWAR